MQFPFGDSFGLYGYGGLSIDTEASTSSPVEGAVAMTGSGSLDTGRERLVSLIPQQDILLAASPATGAIQNHAAAPLFPTGDTNLGGSAYMQLFEMDGTGSVTVTIRHSDDNFVADDDLLFTFTAQTSTSGVIDTVIGPHQRSIVSDSTTIKRDTRAIITIATATRVRLVVALHRRLAKFV